MFGTSTLFSPFFKWYRIALFNLLLVACIGILLRYKLVASLPWVNHKYFLHGHSHFAFSGWISLVLMCAILDRIFQNNHPDIVQKGKWLLWAQLITAYGMLLSFPWQGYAPVSITFSTLSIFVSYAFAVITWPYISSKIWGRPGALAIKASLVYMALSSFGAFWLAALMATHSATQSLYFSALYFFLHFQYNGWFFFAIAGLWLALYHQQQPKTDKSTQRGITILAIACLPAVMLSALWMKVPPWVYVVSVIAAGMQIIGFAYVIPSLLQGWKMAVQKMLGAQKWLYMVAAIALVLRLLLQALSTIPALGKFAFAYRPVVIGYLHLILLGFVTMFLLGYFFEKRVWHSNKLMTNIATGTLLVGFVGTEGTLMLQGLGYIGWISIPYTSEVLLASAILLGAGIAALLCTAKNKPVADL